MKTAIIDVLRVHPNSLYAPPMRITARIFARNILMPDSSLMEVYAVEPADIHSAAEKNLIKNMFPFFHRKILSDTKEGAREVGGYLLSPLNNSDQLNLKSFSSYFAAAEVIANFGEG